jgi:hypothetical protein
MGNIYIIMVGSRWLCGIFEVHPSFVHNPTTLQYVLFSSPFTLDSYIAARAVCLRFPCSRNTRSSCSSMQCWFKIPSTTIEHFLTTLDNCLRAVRATAQSPSIASSFCYSFLSSTATLIVTSTAYTTVTSTPAAPTVISLVGTSIQTLGIVCAATAVLRVVVTTIMPKEKRAVSLAASISSARPSANNAGQTSRFSSACSCFLASSAATSIVKTTSTVYATAATPVS